MDHAAAILIAGPTASGKSALALALAEAIGGVVVNTDSMQVYADLKVITARPSPDDAARAPHLLYGHVDAAENYSAGRYVEDARGALLRAARLGRVPVFVGGTGLYFKALTVGLSAVPPTPPEVRAAVRARLVAEGAPALHAELARLDPGSAARLAENDGVRIARAIEVVLGTGRSLPDWHREGLRPLIDPADAVPVFLAPDRDALYGVIDARFAAMIEHGAVEEVRALAARGLDPRLPAMKAHGVPGLLRHLAGEISLDEAIDKGRQDTRHYAKRQFTWFRHQLADWPRVAPAEAFAMVMRRFG